MNFRSPGVNPGGAGGGYAGPGQPVNFHASPEKLPRGKTGRRGLGRAGRNAGAGGRDLPGVDERLPDNRGYPDRGKAVPGVDIVFAALVNHPDVAVGFRVRIGHPAVYLVQFQRREVIRFIHADDEIPAAFSG